MTRAAPLVSWAIAAVLISPALYTLGAVAAAPEFRDVWPTDTTTAQRIADFFAEPAPAGTRHGVMLGTSGGFCIFGLEPATTDGTTQILSIATLGQGFQDHYPYVDQILALRPDFILIQGPVLLTATPPPPLHEIARRHLRNALLGPPTEAPDVYWARAGSTPEACRAYGTPETWPAEIESETERVTRHRGDPAIRWVVTALGSLASSGIPTFVFDQPRNDYSAAYHDIVGREVDALLAALGPAGRRVTRLHYPERMPMTFFYDPLHVVPAGAAVYRQRLLADVLAALDARPAPR